MFTKRGRKSGKGKRKKPSCREKSVGGDRMEEGHKLRKQNARNKKEKRGLKGISNPGSAHRSQKNGDGRGQGNVAKKIFALREMEKGGRKR